jgi:nucleoid-associated protein YgaU
MEVPNVPSQHTPGRRRDAGGRIRSLSRRPGGGQRRCPHTHVSYQVRRGDNLWRIARRNRTTVAKLVELNAAQHPSLRKNSRLIFAGWKLSVS